MTRAPAEVGSAANSYEILAKLAMGGMAEIFLARGASTAGVERYVVLKRVLRERATDSHFVRMFLDEARLAAQLQHPNIAQVYDIGKLGDSYFFTMEYVHGETVRMLLQRSYGLRQVIPISSVLSIIAGSAAGLHHAHDRKGIDGKPLGIVHRDVSPSNLMISYEGTVKVVDFGVAKAAHRSTETQSGTVKGKICYMSPEQCRGDDIDRRSDLFSLGIVMWEMLTTERLFRRRSDFENMQAIVGEDVPRPSALRPEIPRELDDIVMRLLSKRADDRFQTADELHEAVEAAAVRTGSALSTASLGRYMRELFGQRPEPWIELTAHDSHPEVFTVTSEPIPAELGISPSAELDLRLEQVPRISAQHTSAQAPHAKPAKPTVPLRVEIQDLAMTMPLPEANVVPFERPKATRQQTVPPPPLAPNIPAQVTPAGGMRVHPASGVLQNPAGFPLAFSASHAAYAQRNQPKKKPRRSIALIIIVPAIAIGVALGIVLALRGGDDKPAAVAAGPETKPAPVLDVAPATAVTPPAAAKPAVEPAATPEANQPEAAKPDEAKKPDESKKLDEAKKPDAEKPDEAKNPDPKKLDVQTLFRANRYGEVVVACAASSRTVKDNATTCTVAACKRREGSKARRWFANVAQSKRDTVTKECGSIIPTEAPKAKEKDAGSAVDPCKLDQLACQH